MTSRSGMIAGVLVALLLGGVGTSFAIAWRPAIATIDPPQPQSFAPGLVKRGRVLAALGNCNDCHTVRGGRNFAGGLPVPTPFGTVYSSNITPDVETGIGRWSEAAFQRAMKLGVDREGRHLYPTFPYDHFTNVRDEDDRALYAYLMTRGPVHAPARDNELAFPLNQRIVVAGWKFLFLHPGTYRADPTKSAEWNRGAYLVEGLAHCGACHTPRNALGAERLNAIFAGGDVDHWQAYAINAQSPSPVPWDADALYAYLRDGFHPDHGTARGPMAGVVRNLSVVPADDVRAIASYMADVFGAPSAERRERGEAALAQAKSPAAAAADSAGGAIYAAACAPCHESSQAPPYGGINLVLSSAISSSDPRNLANIVLAGVRPVEGELSPIMPGFAASMNDAEVAALLVYLRSRFSKQPAWSDLDNIVAEARRTQTASLDTRTDARNASSDTAQRAKP
ncbi:MAG: cytochrome c [Bradyrhizobium sp.]|nr:cytochrome c [Bradyrhizobium sp.]